MALGGRARRETVGIGLVLVLLLLANYVAQRYPWRWDATASGIHSLSEQTRKVLEGLPPDVRVLAFYDPDHPARGRVETLLGEYAYRAPRLLWEVVDPVREAAIARLSRLAGPVFDDAYVAQEMFEHDIRLALMRAEAMWGRDAALVAFAKDRSADTERHIEALHASRGHADAPH